MAKIEESDRIVRRPETLSATVDKEVVVLGIESGNYFGLNEMGSEIWERIAEPVMVGTLISELRDKYAGDANSIREDIIGFLSALYDKGLLMDINEAND